MDFLKSIGNDLLNGFSADDIPVFFARIFTAAIIAFIIRLIFNKINVNEEDGIMKHSVLMSIVVATVVPVAQFSISLGLIMTGLIISFILSIKSTNNREIIFTLITLLLASSVGAGYVVYSIIGALIAMLYALISKD